MEHPEVFIKKSMFSDPAWHQLLSKVEASRPLSAQSGSMVSRYAPSTLLFSRSEAMAREKTWKLVRAQTFEIEWLERGGEKEVINTTQIWSYKFKNPKIDEHSIVSREAANRLYSIKDTQSVLEILEKSKSAPPGDRRRQVPALPGFHQKIAVVKEIAWSHVWWCLLWLLLMCRSWCCLWWQLWFQ